MNQWVFTPIQLMQIGRQQDEALKKTRTFQTAPSADYNQDSSY